MANKWRYENFVPVLCHLNALMALLEHVELIHHIMNVHKEPIHVSIILGSGAAYGPLFCLLILFLVCFILTLGAAARGPSLSRS